MKNINLIQNFIENKRHFTILIFIFLIFGTFIFRLVDWQIINHEYYFTRANNTNTYAVKTDAIRGEIVDTNGLGLAINVTGYRLLIDTPKISKLELNDTIVYAVNLIEKLNIEWSADFPIEFKGSKPKFCEAKNNELNQFKKTIEVPIGAEPSECIERLAKKYSCTQFRLPEQIKICAVRYNMERLHGKNTKIIPYILVDNISKENAAFLLDFTSIHNGLEIELFYTRRYEQPDVASHIIGYTGLMSDEEYKTYKEFQYNIDEKIGKTGIESVCEKHLKGKTGKKIIQKGKNGVIIKSFVKEENKTGNTVFLTIDSKLQKIANESLENNIKLAQKRGVTDCNSGATVVLDVNDFSVLAASTYPTYDLNKFVNDSKYYPELLNDTAGKPLINRAFNGIYAPGSTFKPLIALAALQSNSISEKETVHCNGKFSYYKGYTLKCMGHHGNIPLINALAKSCNVYFAELGRRLGSDKIKEFSEIFGCGTETGIELNENKGVISCKEHSQKIGAPWYNSNTSQAAIGQHDNAFTPLQLAVYTATLANGKNRRKVHIIKKITDFSRNNIVKETQPENINDIDVSEENLNIVKKGMREVVLSGTARDFRNFPVEIAAKTGTAENSGSDHTIFLCFAPYNNPKIAIAVIVANGKYGNISKNVAKDILTYYFS